MNEENDIQQFNPEQIALRHHLLRKAYAAPDVQQQLQRFEREHGIGRRGRAWMWGIGAVVAVAASLLLLFVFDVGNVKSSLFRAAQAPVLVYKAAEGVVQRNVTLQQDGDKPVAVPNRFLRMMAKVSAAEARIRNVLSTPHNATAEITLADGTEVTLNADSKLAFPTHFEGATREVQLQGEAFFKVSRDAHRPFVVKTGSITTKVLGTEFNIRAYNKGNANVTLLEGSVEVQAGKATKRLKPGEEAALQAGKIKVSCVETDGVVAWMFGDFYFDNAPLADIAKEIGKWYNVSVIFQDPSKMHTRLFFSAPRDAKIEEIVEVLNELNKAKVTYHDGQITIG